MAETLRVLLVTGRATGGIRAHVSQLAAHLARRGWPVTVLGPAITLQPLRAVEGVHLVQAPIGSPAPRPLRASLLRVRELAADADVVHAHGLRPAVVAAAAGASPLVTTWHNAPLSGGIGDWVHGRLERFAARRATVVLAVSPDLADRARRAGARDVRLIEVPSATARRAPQRGREAVRRELDLTDGRPMVLAVARLDRQKAIDRLVAVAGAWGSAGDPVVVVAGDGPERQRLEKLAQRTGAAIRFLGDRGDVPDLLAAADVVVLPSRWEGWPLAAAEALTAGVPLVASDLSGVRRLAGDAARYVSVGDPAVWRRSIEAVLADPTLAERLRASGHQRVAEWLTIDQADDQLLALYREVESTSRLS